MWQRKVAGDLTNSNRGSYNNAKGFLNRSSVISNVDKTAFERDFPSLGVEERQGGSEIGRVSSPGLSTAIQTAQTIGGDVWTSALAEVPVIIGSRSTTSMQQNVSVTSVSVSPAPSTGLNMAETLVQGPRAQTLPQLSVGTQRLEELAIKQSRQLIPMTPSMPKTLVVSPSEKSKAKVVPQQQHPLHTVNNIRGGPVRCDSPKTFNEARLCVLKPSREVNSVSSTTKDSLSPTNISKVVISPHGTSSPSGSVPFRSSGNSPKKGAERSSGPLRATIEKRPTSQAQSRNDFFNLLKKKSSTNSTSTVPDSSSVSEKSGEIVTEDAGESVPLQVSADSSPLSTNNSGGITQNGDAYDGSQVRLGNGEKHLSPDMVLDPDEEEAAFLRSLGWEENAGEDEGLTEEEISTFVKEYMKLRPSSKLLHGILANHAI
ncbi:uncharacterized protein LOC116108977 isoform X2 [Pistacia vera]|nr:uncharacterized protein LOC116108977 isoform X2 [Pistacia vera]